jgi:nitric oxide reductase NorQ protein
MSHSNQPDPDSHMVKEEPYYLATGNETKLFEAAYDARLPVMLKGPTGCGKSRFVEYIAYKLARPLITMVR